MLSTTIDLSSLLSFQIGVVSSFFLISGLVFLTLFKENKLQIVLGAVLLFWGVLIAKDELYLSHVIPKTDFLYKILLTIDLWVTPCCAIYALELLRPNWINSKYIMVNFIPFILFTLLFTVTHKIIWYHIGIFYTIIYSLIILCFLIYRIFDYRRRMLNQFSSLTNIDIKWFVRIIIVLLICLASWVFVYFQNNYLIDICYYFMLLFIWGYISYYTKLQYVPKSEELDYESSKTEKISDELLIETPHFAFNLNELCHSDYFCKHSQITLTELARELRTNRTSLSNYLNMSLKISFHDFVNMQRVKYAEELLKCNSEARLTQEEIAEQSGFNSLSTFRRAFVKKHNMSPLQYQQQYKVS